MHCLLLENGILGTRPQLVVKFSLCLMLWEFRTFHTVRLVQKNSRLQFFSFGVVVIAISSCSTTNRLWVSLGCFRMIPSWLPFLYSKIVPSLVLRDAVLYYTSKPVTRLSDVQFMCMCN